MPAPVLTAEILAALRSRFGSALADARPQPLAAGEWSRAYVLTLAEREVVVRVGRHGEDYLKDAVAARAFSAPLLPIPEVLTCGEADGLWYAVSERLRGTPLDDLDARQLARALPSLLDTLDAIRSVDLGGVEGFGIWNPDRSGPYADWARALLAVGEPKARLPGWRDALRASPTGWGPFESGLRRLDELAPRLPVARELIHGDLLNRNILIAESTSAVSGVLDWGNSLYGDSLYDAAWLITWWSWFPQWKSIDIRARIRERLWVGCRLPADLDERLLAYQIHIALDGIAYCAFTARWDDVESISRTVARLAAS